MIEEYFGVSERYGRPPIDDLDLDFDLSDWYIPEDRTIEDESDIPENFDEYTITVAENLISREVEIKDGRSSYEGFIQRYDETFSIFEIEDDGENYIVEDPTKIDLLNASTLLYTASIDQLETSPLYDEEFFDPNVESNQEYVETVENLGGLPSLPKVRLSRKDGEKNLQIVDGHRGYRAAQEAGIDKQLVVYEDFGDKEALRRFIEEHIPPKDRQPRHFGEFGYFNEEKSEKVVQNAIELMGRMEALKIDRIESIEDEGKNLEI